MEWYCNIGYVTEHSQRESLSEIHVVTLDIGEKQLMSQFQVEISKQCKRSEAIVMSDLLSKWLIGLHNPCNKAPHPRDRDHHRFWLIGRSRALLFKCDCNFICVCTNWLRFQTRSSNGECIEGGGSIAIAATFICQFVAKETGFVASPQFGVRRHTVRDWTWWEVIDRSGRSTTIAEPTLWLSTTTS